MPTTITTPGRIAFESAVPIEHRAHLSPGAPIETKAIKSILQHVAENNPERYKSISQALLKLGNKGAVETDSSFGLEDLRAPIDTEAVRTKLRADEDRVFARKDLSVKQKQNELVKLYGALSNEMPGKVYDAAMAKGSNLARMVATGARGNKQQLNSNVGMDGLIIDANGDPVPIALDRSYSEGLSPAQYFGASYGTRQGLVTLKQAVPDAGFLCLVSYQMVRMADFSTKAIQDIMVGDWVLGSDRFGFAQPVRVSAIFQNGVRPVYRHRFRYGKSRTRTVEIEATEEHKILARHGAGAKYTGDWEISPLAKNGNSFRAIPVQGVSGDGEAEPRAFLLGYLLGDGCLGGNDTTFATADPLVVEAMGDHGRPFNLQVKKCRTRERDYEYRISETVRTVNIVRNALGRAVNVLKTPFRAWLQEMRALGKMAHQKIFPRQAWMWDDASAAQLVAGLLESDGCVSYSNNSTVPIVSFFVTAKDLAEGLEEFLRVRFAVYSSGVQFRKKPANGNHDIWGFCVNDRQSILRLAKHIPMPGKKGNLLRRKIIEIKQSVRRDLFVYSYLDREFLGERPTYDIEVDHPDHLFVLANGMIVSNSKQLSAANQDLIVTAHDCGTRRGLPVDAQDKDNVGALLARDTAGHKAGTAITSRMFNDFKSNGIKRLLVRSPITCGQEHGICASCAGIREHGTLEAMNSNLGIAASSSVGEPLSQGLISSKHGAGVANASKSSRATGFKAVNQLVQIPKTFEGGATSAQHDGTISKIEPSPTGGYHVHVDDGQSD